MAGFAKSKAELDSLGASVVAASVDAIDKAREVGAEVGFPVAHGVTRDIAEEIGAWWDPNRNIVQPSEFIVDGQGKVLSSTYSSGPIGRVEPADAIKLMRLYESRKAKK